MDLSKQSRRQIIKYVMSSEVSDPTDIKLVMKHLAKLEKYGQIDADEDEDGNLIYAIGWWKLSDAAVQDWKKYIRPKRFNRGRNIVGLFMLSNKQMGMGRVRRIINRCLRMEKAKTLSIRTPKDKWITVKTERYINPKSYKQRRAAEVFKILGGSHG